MIFFILYGRKIQPVKRTHLLLSLLLACSVAFSQKQANFWQFGTLAGLDFNSGSPVALTNSPVNTTEGCASISDASGNLLFYTEGVNVWDKNNTQMPNGTGLFGDFSTTQSALIIPKPGSTSLYYIFTLDEEGGPNGLCYSIVDMTLNSGNGDVTTKNAPLRANMTEKLTAVFHCNGTDIWVMTHDLNTNGFVAYLVTATGIGSPVISNTGPVHTDVHGQMKFSTSGAKLALARDTVVTPGFPTSAVGFVDLFDFNTATGIVSSPLILNIDHQRTYGIEFSPDDSKLYASYYDLTDSSVVLQFDMNAADIEASKEMVGAFFSTGFYALQLGPDGKIYVTNSITPFLDAITAPNQAGVLCNYMEDVVDLDPGGMGNVCMLGLPGFVQSYFYPAFPTVPPCPSIGIAEQLHAFPAHVYFDSDHNQLNLSGDFDQTGILTLDIIDITGRTVYKTTITITSKGNNNFKTTVPGLVPGIYIARMTGQSVLLQSKFRKE